ncbi:MAG: hypoxanthine phosphoribosyltransferase, partial [Endomicrobiaceae bacterium]|nr:hypoxanthine phosphoribosyltransferase [Endomicrobiaceae bacterium]
MIKQKDIKIKKIISKCKIQKKVSELAKQINRDYQKKDLVVLSVLSGSIVFCSDIIRKLDVNFKLNFIKVSSYIGKKSVNKIQIGFPFSCDVSNKDVLVIEDIYDTGRTLSYLQNFLLSRKAKSITFCVLVDKKVKKYKKVKIKYCGFDIDNQFIVGYGLDFNEKFRGLPYI